MLQLHTCVSGNTAEKSALLAARPASVAENPEPPVTEEGRKQRDDHIPRRGCFWRLGVFLLSQYLLLSPPLYPPSFFCPVPATQLASTRKVTTPQAGQEQIRPGLNVAPSAGW